MLGLGDGWVAAAYLANIAAAAVCVIYGAINWNRSDEDDQQGGDR